MHNWISISEARFTGINKCSKAFHRRKTHRSRIWAQKVKQIGCNEGELQFQSWCMEEKTTWNFAGERSVYFIWTHILLDVNYYSFSCLAILANAEPTAVSIDDQETLLLLGRALRTLSRGGNDLLADYSKWFQMMGADEEENIIKRKWEALRPSTNCDEPIAVKARAFLRKRFVSIFSLVSISYIYYFRL